MKDRPIRVLVVEDSSTARMLLVQILNSDPRLQVVGTAANGVEALRFLGRKSPDVILMDAHMPQMDGLEATRKIMETRPAPIVICSASIDQREAISTFRLLEAGAVACIDKPRGREHKDYESSAAELVQTVKLMSEVKVVRRWHRPHIDAPLIAVTPDHVPEKIECVGIGASTGGPPVLQTILSALPKDFPVPILIVQHISPGFLAGLADWLNQTTPLPVHIAGHNTDALPGHVYLAPEDYHLAMGSAGRIALSKAAAINGVRPSVDHLFGSLADVCGQKAVGVLLTGMGKDGAENLKMLKDRGAITIAQDQKTSVVFGMPGQAVALGAATFTLAADQIAPALLSLVRRQFLPNGGHHERRG